MSGQGKAPKGYSGDGAVHDRDGGGSGGDGDHSGGDGAGGERSGGSDRRRAKEQNVIWVMLFDTSVAYRIDVKDCDQAEALVARLKEEGATHDFWLLANAPARSRVAFTPEDITGFRLFGPDLRNPLLGAPVTNVRRGLRRQKAK